MDRKNVKVQMYGAVCYIYPVHRGPLIRYLAFKGNHMCTKYRTLQAPEFIHYAV